MLGVLKRIFIRYLFYYKCIDFFFVNVFEIFFILFYLGILNVFIVFYVFFYVINKVFLIFYVIMNYKEYYVKN